MRRVLSLAYMLVWAWEEHKQAASTQKENPTDKIVLLFDEVEAHLHPKWQRVFLPALLSVVDSLLHKDVSLSDKDKTKTVQIIATTHAPLVLASVEKEWDDTRDELFDFDLLQEKNQKPKVVFQSRLFVKRGSVQNWLVSESFNLRTAV
jgi:AAA15 family ATPase/GTPase